MWCRPRRRGIRGSGAGRASAYETEGRGGETKPTFHAQPSSRLDGFLYSRATIRRVHAQPSVLRGTMPDLPSGTVTFLFTDIEGSTALWEQDRTATRQAVEHHLALLRTAIEAHGGVLFKIVGDASQSAFSTAPAAIAAAAAAQQGLVAEPWSDPPGPLRVRMALHAGEAIPDARGDYLAGPLNRLSRLLAAG